MIGRLKNKWAAFAHDFIMIPVAWLAAYWLRYNMHGIPRSDLEQAVAVLPALLAVQGIVFWYFGLYRGVWRFASMPDLVRIIRAVVVGVAVSMIVVFLWTRMEHIPRSVFPLYCLLLVFLLGGSRLLYRWLVDYRMSRRGGKRVLVVGAGRAGEMLARDLLRDPQRTYVPVGFADDAASKRGKDIHGIRVLGRCDGIPEMVADFDVEVILIALPSANSKQMRRIVDYCNSSGVPFRTLPRLEDLVTGRASFKELREVRLEDLLGREPVSLDWRRINTGLSGQVIMISGGGGSIGSELCRQVARMTPAAIIIFERNEFNLYSIEMELRARYPDLKLHALLGDVCDPVAVKHALETYQPQIVFHAAAYKHVPMLEHQVREAVRNNILGTRTLAQAVDKAGCAAFVMISTDKAVNPTNVMGATKRAAEIYCQNLDRYSATRFITVRFGNVLDSAGSVVPLFRKQIERGGPVTVTHPEITRYFMTIPEASQLIMQAAVAGNGGEIFVLNMGEPVQIAYLAEQMIRLSGKTPGEDVEIIYTGLRPGEKLYEELFYDHEDLAQTEYKSILLARYREVDWAELNAVIEGLAAACDQVDPQQLEKFLRTLVPEFTSTAESGAGNVVPLKKATA